MAKVQIVVEALECRAGQRIADPDETEFFSEATCQVNAIGPCFVYQNPVSTELPSTIAPVASSGRENSANGK